MKLAQKSSLYCVMAFNPQRFQTFCILLLNYAILQYYEDVLLPQSGISVLPYP